MVLQELEHEVEVQDRLTPEQPRLDELERQLRHLDAEISDKQMVLRALQRKDETHADALEALGPVELAAAKRTVKEALDRLRAELRASMLEHQQLEQTLDVAFNPHWGPLFREGHEISKFGEQVEAYACVYTSRVTTSASTPQPPLPAPRPDATRAIARNWNRPLSERLDCPVAAFAVNHKFPIAAIRLMVATDQGRISMTNSRVSACIVGTIVALFGSVAAAQELTPAVAADTSPGESTRRGWAWRCRPCPRERSSGRPACSAEMMMQSSRSPSCRRSTFR